MEKKKKILFSIIGVSLPFIVLFLIEIALRLFNIPKEQAIFLTDPNNTSYYIVNPAIGQRFLENPNIKPPLSFISKKKGGNEVRIVVMGASTTVGFPFGHEIAFPKILKHKLQCQFPDKKINIINVGLTAINTYTILEMVNEVIEISPNFVILYAGQNEFYGRYGIASTFSTGGLPPFIVSLYINLLKLNTLKLIKKAFPPDEKESKKNKTLMAKMVGNKEIRFDSKPYNNALTQYSVNLNKIIKKFKRQDIPLLIGTLVSNESGLSPFNSKPFLPALKLNKKKGDSLFNKGEIESALRVYLTMTERDSSVANLYFKIANCFFSLKKYDSAKLYYKYANKFDLLRFRAPLEFNTIIKSKSEFSNVIIVDVNNAFEKNSPNNIIGNELLLEHVHPTIKGYKLMAQSFFNAIIETNLIDRIQPVSKKSNCSNHFVSKVDSIYGKLLIARLKKNWPFLKTTNSYNKVNFVPKNSIEQLAYNRFLNRISWAEATNQLYAYYLKEKKFDKAFETAYILSEEYPIIDVPVLLMVKSLLKSKNYKKADSLLVRYIQLIPSDKLKKKYFHVLLLKEDIEKSISFLNASYFNSDKNILLKKLKDLQKAKHNYDSLQSSHENALALAKKYATFGLIENASKYRITADSLLAIYE